jgi:hypothetical protein
MGAAMVDVTTIDFIRELTPDNAWKLRWAFDLDMNHDGQVTITDIGMLCRWIFFAPGDCLLLGIMLKLPGVATFLELTPAYLYGWWSLFISLFTWGSVPTLYR